MGVICSFICSYGYYTGAIGAFFLGLAVVAGLFEGWGYMKDWWNSRNTNKTRES